ncbi:fatty-acid synthase (plasmid) [Streptomyces clavuligerus]|nr:fatty acid synthase [Streptomyces clavuligerus]QCS09795.1 fatty-acid synthase [Streptomyces clavuligerus]QPJ98162.1 fatty-acid synthase [Streptomyces clavuligerus]
MRPNHSFLRGGRDFGGCSSRAVKVCGPSGTTSVGSLMRDTTGGGTEPADEPIAVIGLSCRFPGARDTDAFWRLLSTGTDAVDQGPVERTGGGASRARGGFLDQVDRFDPAFFGMSPQEADATDPQQRLVLEVGWEALENAGVRPDGTGRLGVFVGAM